LFFLDCCAAHFLIGASASVEFTMEEKKFFGKEHRSAPSRTGDSALRELLLRARNVVPFRTAR
jgi:hypothetical protein